MGKYLAYRPSTVSSEQDDQEPNVSISGLTLSSHISISFLWDRLFTNLGVEFDFS